MTEAMPFLQKTILLSYDPRSLRRGLLMNYAYSAFMAFSRSARRRAMRSRRFCSSHL